MTEKLKTDIIEFVGAITQKDIDEGGVLIFRINDRAYPKHVLNEVVESVKRAVTDNFNGQVKAIILPDTISVELLPKLIKEHNEDEHTI